ncbi:MAG: hypothetical protein DRP63_09975 [Planctomycetota bacterium]|nr:MAG: hypothetical protein DRP63_09975 [Planctomycetota bacterium]
MVVANQIRSVVRQIVEEARRRGETVIAFRCGDIIRRLGSDATDVTAVQVCQAVTQKDFCNSVSVNLIGCFGPTPRRGTVIVYALQDSSED